MWRVGLYSKREGASDMSGVEVIARDAGVVIEHNNLYSWWRCENCGRRGQDNHSNKSTVRHLLPSLQRKAQSHLKSCPARPSSWQRAFTKPIAVSGLPIPVYFVREHPGYLTEQLGASWLRDHADEGAPLILVSTHANATNNDVISRLVRGGVPYSIPKNFPPLGWQGGPVLAPWPSPQALQSIERFPRLVTSLCVLEWLEGEFDDWLSRQEAIEIIPANP